MLEIIEKIYVNLLQADEEEGSQLQLVLFCFDLFNIIILFYFVKFSLNLFYFYSFLFLSLVGLISICFELFYFI